MRVLADLRFMTGRAGGKESYVEHLYPELARVAADIEWLALAPRPLAARIRGWFPGSVSTPDELRLAAPSSAGDGPALVASAAELLAAQLIHCPADVGPAASTVPVLLTIHDALPFTHPEWVMPPSSAERLRLAIRDSARAAWHIITDSAVARSELLRQLPGVGAPVSVVPLAGDQPEARRGETVERHGLFVPGRRAPHKDAATVLRAIASLPPAQRPRVVLTGTTARDPLRPLIADLELGDRVILEGWLDRAEVDAHYASAAATVFPTLFEGFGLPVLEAMARGCPVICSDLPVLREVGGDAAVYATPGDARAFAAAIERVLGDRALRDRLAAAGRERAAGFGWERTARLTLDIIRSAPTLDAFRSDGPR